MPGRILKIALILFIPILFFFVLEFLLRFAWYQPPSNFSKKTFMERDGHTVMISGVKGMSHDKEFSVEVAGNSFGYREGTWPEQASTGKVVWLFGDSFAFGWGVEARQTFAAILNEHGFAVYDLAIPGDGWDQYQHRLEWAKKNLPKPDYILAAVYDNDFILPHAIKNNFLRRLSNIRYALVTKSQIARLIKRVTYNLGVSGVMAPLQGSEMNVRVAYGRDITVHEKNYLNSESAKTVLDKMSKFLEDSKLIASETWIFRIVPGYCNGMVWQDEVIKEVGKPKETYDFNQLDAELGRVCGAHSAKYARFAAKTDQESNEYYFRHDLHLTAKGHEAVANQLLQELNSNQ